MQVHGFKPEEYPIVIQIITQRGVQYLSAFQPDFDYRVIEVFRKEEIGQSEMMIIKVRREIASRISREKNSPTPLKSAALYKIPEQGNISTTHAAKILGVTSQTIRRWADQGILKATPTRGGHRRFSEETVQDALAKMSQSTSTDSELPNDRLESHTQFFKTPEATREI